MLRVMLRTESSDDSRHAPAIHGWVGEKLGTLTDPRERVVGTVSDERPGGS